jgi:hypothetical protein
MRGDARGDAKVKNPASKDRISRLRFYGEQFILDTVSGSFYRLTPAAGFILKALIERTDYSKLAEMVQNRFGTSRSQAARDVELFLSELRSLDLIENPGH